MPVWGKARTHGLPSTVLAPGLGSGSSLVQPAQAIVLTQLALVSANMLYGMFLILGAGAGKPELAHVTVLIAL